jgi:hypothetical protein
MKKYKDKLEDFIKRMEYLTSRVEREISTGGDKYEYVSLYGATQEAAILIRDEATREFIYCNTTHRGVVHIPSGWSRHRMWVDVSKKTVEELKKKYPGLMQEPEWAMSESSTTLGHDMTRVWPKRGGEDAGAV